MLSLLKLSEVADLLKWVLERGLWMFNLANIGDKGAKIDTSCFTRTNVPKTKRREWSLNTDYWNQNRANTYTNTHRLAAWRFVHRNWPSHLARRGLSVSTYQMLQTERCGLHAMVSSGFGLSPLLIQHWDALQREMWVGSSHLGLVRTVYAEILIVL